MVIIICIISVLPWIGLGNFSTQGEPEEAEVAISMLETGNWVLPQVHSDTFVYHPPMADWLMAFFSYPQGYVSEFTSHLPSALAFVVLIGFVLVFFGRRIKFQQAFIATLLLITCLQMHRGAMSPLPNMLFTAFVVIGLFQLFNWEDQLELKGLPVIIPILLGCVILTRGLTSVLLPLFIFGVYLLLLRKYSLLTIFKSLLYTGISSLFLPILWYLAAYKQGGNQFLQLVFAENSSYEFGILYYFGTLIAGFVPWTIFFFFSLFGLQSDGTKKSFKTRLNDCRVHIRTMEKEKLFSIVALICIFIFYAVIPDKRSFRLMPAYPFIAIFLAQYAIYITEYRTKVTRIFAAFLAAVVAVVFIAIVLTMTGVIDLVAIAGQYTDDLSTLNMLRSVSGMLISPDGLTIVVLIILFILLLTVYYQMFKKINIKILYATIALTFGIHLFVDCMIMRSSYKENSISTAVEQETATSPSADENVIINFE